MQLSDNIKYMRKQMGLTQAELAEKLGLKRPVIGAYEEGRAEPRLQTLTHMASFFGVNIDAIVNTDLSTGESSTDASGKSLRVLPIAIDANDNTERTTLVPVKAAAGYTAGYGDIDFVSSLPTFSLPFPELPSDRTYRVFQIEGESMLPIPPGSYVISEYVQDWDNLKTDERYIFITKDDGLVFKRVRVHPHKRSYELISDNADFKPYFIKQSQVLEVWRAKGMMTFNMDGLQSGSGSMKQILEAIERIDRKL